MKIPPTDGKTMSNYFYKALRRSDNLFSAWRHVRKNALLSSNHEIRSAANDFESKAHTRINSIQRKLRNNTYKFPKAEGILKDKKERAKKGKEPRPIVINPLEGRVVQRAILQVLQPKNDSDLHKKLGKIKDVNESPYGIGGIPSPHGGVSVGIRSILKDINEGFIYFFKSDIRSFFSCIPRQEVISFILNETQDEQISQIFHDGLNVELNNKEELGKYNNLFPRDEIGVPQGSPLSAFAGNILLYQLDHSLNSDNTRAYRYIDDLIIIGKTDKSVQLARSKAKKWLNNKGMTLYNPAQDPDKSEEGHIKNGFVYLGCRITKNQVTPSKNSQNNLIKKIKEEIKKSQKNILSLYKDHNKKRKTELTYIQSLFNIDKIIYGWGQSFSFCNNRLPFENLDKKVNSLLDDFEKWYFHRKTTVQPSLKRRMLGVTLLTDIDRKHL